MKHELRVCVSVYAGKEVRYSMKDVVKQPNGQLCFSSLCYFLSCTCRELWQSQKKHTRVRTHILYCSLQSHDFSVITP